MHLLQAKKKNNQTENMAVQTYKLANAFSIQQLLQLPLIYRRDLLTFIKHYASLCKNTSILFHLW